MNKLKKLLCFLICPVILAFSSCRSSTLSPNDGIINYIIPASPDTLDPQIANGTVSRLLIMNIFEGLTRLDESEQVVSGAAERWDISPDGLIYTFTLRENTCWNNGEALTPDDFVFGLQRTLSPVTDSPNAELLYCIKNAEKIHNGEKDISALGVHAVENKLIFELEYPDSSFLYSLSEPCAMPCSRSFFESTKGRYCRDEDKILSNGAFYVSGYGSTYGESIKLRRNEKYHGQNISSPAGVNFNIGSEPEDICKAVSEGQTDCFYLPKSDLKTAGQYGLDIVVSEEEITGISFNMNNGILADKQVRTALLSALKHDDILDGLPEYCRPVYSIIPQADGTYPLSESMNSISYSANAADNLKNALTKIGADSLPKLTILCPDDTAAQSTVNNIIKRWNKVTGGYVNKKPMPLCELKEHIVSGDYTVIMAPLTDERYSPYSVLELFSSNNNYSPAKLRDSKYDEIISQLKKVPQNTAKEQAASAQDYLFSNSVFYPLYSEKAFYAVSPDIKGLIIHHRSSFIDFSHAEKRS